MSCPNAIAVVQSLVGTAQAITHNQITAKAEACPGDVKWQFVSTTNDYERYLLCPSTGEPVAVSQRQR